jgi:serine/threonine protein kinase
MKQLLAGVTYLHERQICHRDLKLDNIFLAREMKIKIGDFGAACKFDPGTKLTYRCGTTQVRASVKLQRNIALPLFATRSTPYTQFHAFSAVVYGSGVVERRCLLR